MSSLTRTSDCPSTIAGQAALERLRHWPGEHRVAVGLSGGVDSSLTAALLVEAGWEVEGLTLWLMSGKGACCCYQRGGRSRRRSRLEDSHRTQIPPTR